MFAAGAAKVQIYSLIDDAHRSAYHGLTDGSLVNRKTFHSLTNLMALFQDRKTFTRKSLDFTLTNTTSAMKHQLFQKSNGTFLLTIYQDVDSYDRVNLKDISVTPVKVRLDLALRASEIEVFTPTMGVEATQTASNVKTLTIPVANHVTVVTITQSGTVTTRSDTSTQSASTTT